MVRNLSSFVFYAQVLKELMIDMNLHQFMIHFARYFYAQFFKTLL